MGKQKLVLVEVDDRGDPIRIFKSHREAYQLPVEQVQEVPHAYAVKHIRLKVFARAGCTPHQSGQCEWCGRGIIWERGFWTSGHLHEQVARGKGGEVSVDNSVAICVACHLGPNGAHSNRRWHSAKIRNSDESN